jgi:Flp pilus assembly protein CpaB
LKRSNRVMLLLGIVLACAAFGGVLLFGRPAPAAEAAPVTVSVVTAAIDLPLGTSITTAQLETVQKPVADALDTYRDPVELEGQVVRRLVRQGEALTSRDFQTLGGAAGADVGRALTAGQRAIAVRVDSLSGVGTLIQAGDFVDVIAAVSDESAKFPIVLETERLAGPEETDETTETDETGEAEDIDETGEADLNEETAQDEAAEEAEEPFKRIDDVVNNTSVKMLVQNVQVLGLLDPGPAASNTAPADPEAAPQAPGVIVILSVTAQEAELVRFAQLDGNLSLVMRSPADAAATPDTTTGITLRELVDNHGVLPPRAIISQFP